MAAALGAGAQCSVESTSGSVTRVMSVEVITPCIRSFSIDQTLQIPHKHRLSVLTVVCFACMSVALSTVLIPLL